MPVKPIPNNPWEADELAGDDYSADAEVRDTPVLLGGAGATMSAARDDGQGLARVWQEAARKLREALGGHPDQAEAEAAGIHTQPTAAKMLETGLAGLSAAQGGALMASGVGMAGAGVGALRGQGGARLAGKLAEVIENPRSLVTGPLRRYAARGAKAADDAAPVAEAPAPAGAGNVTPFPSRVAQEAPATASAGDDLAAYIMRLRKDHGLSGAQITSVLREQRGIPPSQGQKMVEMVLEQLMVRR